MRTESELKRSLRNNYKPQEHRANIMNNVVSSMALVLAIFTSSGCSENTQQTKPSGEKITYPYLQHFSGLSVGIPQDKFFNSLRYANIDFEITGKTDEYIVLKGHPLWNGLLSWDITSAKTLVRVMEDGFVYSVSSGGSYDNKEHAQRNFSVIKTAMQNKFGTWKIIESKEDMFHRKRCQSYYLVVLLTRCEIFIFFWTREDKREQSMQERSI